MSVVANVAINVDATNAITKLRQVDQAAKGIKGGLDTASDGAKGFGGALQAALGPLLAFTTAVAVVQKSLTTAFERGAAEQRLKNLTSSTQEYQIALGIAAQSADKFGMSQTDTTKALADVYSRLKGVGFGLKETAQIYEGFNVIAKQSGMTAEDASGSFFQLSQALGKGKLNGDEFVIVAERMPQLLDAIATATGKSRGELQQMASDGKITSQVLYQALATSAGAAGDLNAKLTEQQRVMNSLGQVSDKLLNSIGQVFAPLVIKGAEMLAWAGQKLSEWWDYIGGVVFPKVYEAVKPVITEMQKISSSIPWDTIIGYIQGALVNAINNVVAVLKFLSPILAGIIGKFIELSNNPVFKFIAEQVQRLANFLGLSSTAVTDYKQKQDAAKEGAAELVKNYSSLPLVVDTVKEKTKELAEYTARYASEAAKASNALNETAAASSNQAAYTQALSEAQTTINNLNIQSLQTALATTKDLGTRIKIVEEIKRLEINNAKLAYLATTSQIQAQVESLRIAYKQVQVKKLELEAVVALARAQGLVNQGHLDALGAQQSALRIAAGNLATGEKIAKASTKAAAEVYKSAVGAANLRASTSLAAKDTANIANSMAKAAGSAGEFASNLNQARTGISVSRSQLEDYQERYIANAIKELSKKKGYTRAEAVDLELDLFRYFTASNKATQQASDAQKIAEFAAKSGITPEQAVGFSVSSKFGLIRTSPEELTGPRIAAASANYLASQRRGDTMTASSSGNTQINVTTGPVMEFDGEKYVTLTDMEKAMRKTADGVYANLRTPSGRYATGVR